ncbi:GNAT family N-acetyltransferase [Pareuzebyella sediminis]|uniref:GNAT family N-acetyltransferase n=1 Tax=Pareuzebyella sediminis TaxID=2607998 RepID=UPI0011EEF1EC|nr:GNAT family N-acetyltransferase [Pareuzebyella sediminis]
MRIRLAIRDDIPAIVAMLANDPLGRNREKFQDILPEPYYTAFEKITQDANQELIVGESESGEIIATLQLSFIQYLTYRGGIRAQIEAVRVHETRRNEGIGQKVLEWAIARAKEKGAHLVQLTTDKKRGHTLRFYEKLGFRATHEGMKLHLDND